MEKEKSAVDKLITKYNQHIKGRLSSGKYDHLKDKPIVTYCTGGIRCEVLSSDEDARV